MEDQLTLEQSIKIVMELAEESVIHIEDAQLDPELMEVRERQLQALANIDYNFNY